MTEHKTAKARAGVASFLPAKQLATMRAQAALAGARLVAIEGDDGGVELVLTEGAATLRFHDLQAANSAIAMRSEHRELANRRSTASGGHLT